MFANRQPPPFFAIFTQVPHDVEQLNTSHGRPHGSIAIPVRGTQVANVLDTGFWLSGLRA